MNSYCSYYSRNRDRHSDAGLGDTVPHMREVHVVCVADGSARQGRQNINWWRGRQVHFVFHRDTVYCMGSASGDECNCLIDALRQCLDVIFDVRAVRDLLQQRHRRLILRDYLELELHWRDVIEGIGLVMGLNLTPESFRIICVDALHLGNGDVEGTGARTLYIARQNANHFVPLFHCPRGVEQIRAAASNMPVPLAGAASSSSGQDDSAGGTARGLPEADARAAGGSQAEARPERREEAAPHDAERMHAEGGAEHAEEVDMARDGEEEKSKEEAGKSPARAQNDPPCEMSAGRSQDREIPSDPWSKILASGSVEDNTADATVFGSGQKRPRPSSSSDASDQSESESLSSEGDVDSDASDYLHVAVSVSKTFTVPQDRDLECAIALSKRLRDRPLLPPHPLDATQSWSDVDDGIQLPTWHCAFSGCAVTFASEEDLALHLCNQHGDIFRAVCPPQKRHMACTSTGWYMAWYVYAIRVLERRGIPAHGVSIDRRSMNLVSEVFNDDRIRSLICSCCAQQYVSWSGLDEITHPEALRQPKSPIRMIAGRYFIEHLVGTEECNRQQFSAALFKERYMSADSSLSVDPDLADDCWEWRRVLRYANGIEFPIMCCPEDIRSCGPEVHAPEIVAVRVQVCEDMHTP